MSEFTQRTITAHRIGYVSKGRRVVVWKDVETGEEFHIYADDLLKLFGDTEFVTNSKVVNRNGGYDRAKLLRIKEDI